LELLNTSDSLLSGTIQFFGQGSVSNPAGPVTLTVNGQSGTTFNYTISPRGTATLETSGTPQNIQVGSIRITPTAGALAPSANASLTFSQDGVLVTETTFDAESLSTAYRMYAEAVETTNPFASFQTSVTVANTSTTPTSVTFDLRNLD